MAILRPQLIPNPNFQEVVSAAEALVTSAWSENERAAKTALLYRTDLYRQSIFEAVMMSLYGPDFFEKSYNLRVEEVDH